MYTTIRKVRSKPEIEGQTAYKAVVIDEQDSLHLSFVGTQDSTTEPVSLWSDDPDDGSITFRALVPQPERFGPFGRQWVKNFLDGKQVTP